MLVLFSRTKRRSTTLKQFDELAPEIGAEEYDALKDFPGPFVVGPKSTPDMLLSPPFVEFRVCHPLRINKNLRQWEMRPHYLMPGTRPEAGQDLDGVLSR